MKSICVEPPHSAVFERAGEGACSTFFMLVPKFLLGNRLARLAPLPAQSERRTEPAPYISTHNR
jgi:hypothetical protein